VTPRHSQIQSGLSRRRLGVMHIFFFSVAASAPLTVLGGGVTTTFAVTGNVGVPLSFVVLAAILALFAVGYAAMSRYVSNAGAFYAYLANGLGRSWGVAGSFVAVVSYNAIQIGLYGLMGFALQGFVVEKTGVDLPWWMWAAGTLVLVAVLGVLRVDLNARILAVLLALEILAVVVYDIGAFGHPAGGSVSVDGLLPQNLFVPGVVGAVLAFGIAAFVGFESAAIYSEECRDPRRTVARATFAAVAFTGVFYALSAWAMSVTNGPEEVAAAAAEAGPGLVFGALAEHWSPIVADIANVLFLTSVFAALLSFHNSVSRYLFALGREHVLPTFLGRVGVRSRAPIAGSIAQTVTAVVILSAFAVGGGDPLLGLFTWFSGLSAVGIVLLMTGTSAAVVGFFAKRQTEETLWQRAIAPTLATVLLGVVVFLLVANFDALLGPSANTPLRWILPGVVGAAAIIGLLWGVVLKSRRPEVYRNIGRSVMESPEDIEDEYEDEYSEYAHSR
jgi:amino acid transporter